MQLYRAADDPPFTGQWSCWAETRAGAEAYRDNPGFGGAHLFCATIADYPDYVLDLRRGGMAALYDALYPDADADTRGEALETWRADYEQVYQAWEGIAEIARLLPESYDWIVYEDDYPARCVTWVYLGDTPLPVEVLD